MKGNAYEIFIYNIDVGYLPVSEMGHVAMLHSNLRGLSLLKLLLMNINSLVFI